MANEPVLYHKTFRSTDCDVVSKAVMAKVAELNVHYIQIRVIVHTPATKVYSNGESDTVYATTIIASKDDKYIDIGFHHPPE